jgi:hypothetical protein
MNEFLEVLRVLAKPIELMIDLLMKDDHSEEEERQIVLAFQRAVADARARRKFGAGP